MNGKELKKIMIEQQCWREQLIGMTNKKDIEKVRKKLKESIERSMG